MTTTPDASTDPVPPSIPQLEAVTWTVLTETDTLSQGTGTRDEAWAAYERDAAQADHETRHAGSVVRVVLRIDGQPAAVRTVGALASDRYAMSGWKYLRQVATHLDPTGFLLTADVEDTGGSHHVPVIRVGSTHVITVVDDGADGEDVAYSVGVETAESWEQIRGDYLAIPWDGAYVDPASLGRLDGADLVRFLRAALAVVASPESASPDQTSAPKV